jgi:glycerol kinase
MRVLAIDQGTSATKALVEDSDGSILSSVEEPVSPVASAGGAVEQDPEELWASVLAAGRRAIAEAGQPVDAVGFANQGETVLAWDRASGRPRTPCISWQDRRAVQVTDRLAAHGPDLHELTGLPLDPYFAAPKMTFIREQLTAEGVVTTSDVWLVHRLAGTFVTDAATASRTMLLDLDSSAWSEHACAIFGLDKDEQPTVLDTAGLVGETCAFGAAVPVYALCVDQQAALYGQSCLAPGQAKCTYGTGAFLLVNTGARALRSASGLASSVAWRLAGTSTYCLDGQVYAAGSAFDWLAHVGLVRSVDELDGAASTEKDSGGVVFCPAFGGLGAPFWRPRVKASFTGIGLDTSRGHLLRAVVDGIAASVVVLVQAACDDLGRPLDRLRVDGGVTRSAVLMQTQADLLQLPIDVFFSPHATALGIAALARRGAREAPPAAERAPIATYEPQISPGEAANRVDRWRTTVEATTGPAS